MIFTTSKYILFDWNNIGGDNMPNIIYTDSIISDNGLPVNNTPAAVFSVTDLETILDRIKDGSIQCGTGQPYPVAWENDNMDREPPWDNTVGMGNQNPWKNY